VVVGSAMASLCVERYGTEGLLEVTPDALDARVRAFGRLVHTDAEGD
jgi:hypothetical protein